MRFLRSRLARCLVAMAAVALLIPPTLALAGQVITGNCSMNLAFTESVNSGVIVPYSIPATVSANLSYANGTASNQVDTIYSKQITLSATTTTLNLTTLTDPAGNSINFARVREFIVVNTSSTAGYDVKVEAGASNGWSPLPPSTSPLYARYSGSLRISDPVSTGTGNGNVVTSTSNTITLDPGANTITVNVLIVGGSAA